LAQVSTATVSRVMNNPNSVEPATRQKVLDAATKLRYVPHGAARTLRSHRSRMIGAIVPSFDYALYARTTSALQRRLAERGRECIAATVEQARREFASGQTKPMTASEIVGEALS
jgi:LacI family transcriptional regulator